MAKITTTCSRCPLYKEGRCLKDETLKEETDYCEYGIFARQIRAIQFYAYGDTKIKEQAKKVIRDCYIDLLKIENIDINLPIISKNGSYKGIIGTGSSQHDDIYNKAKDILGGKYIYDDILGG